MCACVCFPPVEEEDKEDQHKGHQISKNPHQFVLIGTLRSRSEETVWK